MTNATEIIEAFNKLPTDEQAQVTEFVLSRQPEDVFVFTHEESLEIDRRLKNLEQTKSADEVFAKYGL